MIASMARLRRKQENGESGFTLIELLVVVVIIGILVAIAVPLYLNYRKGANDRAAQSDVRSAISSLEQCNADSGTGSYPTGINGTGATDSCKVSKSDSTGTLTYNAPTTTSNGAYRVFAKATSGGGSFYCYSSGAGGSLKPVTTEPSGATNAC